MNGIHSSRWECLFRLNDYQLYLEKACDSDDVHDSVHYGESISKLIDHADAKLDGLHKLAREVTDLAAFAISWSAVVEEVKVIIEALKMCLMADVLGDKDEAETLRVVDSRERFNVESNLLERKSKQRVIFDNTSLRILLANTTLTTCLYPRLCRASPSSDEPIPTC